MIIHLPNWKGDGYMEGAVNFGRTKDTGPWIFPPSAMTKKSPLMEFAIKLYQGHKPPANFISTGDYSPMIFLASVLFKHPHFVLDKDILNFIFSVSTLELTTLPFTYNLIVARAQASNTPKELYSIFESSEDTLMNLFKGTDKSQLNLYVDLLSASWQVFLDKKLGFGNAISSSNPRRSTDSSGFYVQTQEELQVVKSKCFWALTEDNRYAFIHSPFVEWFPLTAQDFSWAWSEDLVGLFGTKP